ncbi:hypothetical protein SOCEGT47_065490 [Sorangium cellulosum]|uniref:Uncharacterized protein n=1 Tax=Sorangium cellulosum TaxID=56 RepID=A0A4P2Q9S4_SORCE|nr:hypothetical protein [Sorangium cellulosum]AUX25996.1 hypothetical protein SOCEGT47_065490 [Sorangium cellulosum]
MTARDRVLAAVRAVAAWVDDPSRGRERRRRLAAALRRAAPEAAPAAPARAAGPLRPVLEQRRWRAGACADLEAALAAGDPRGAEELERLLRHVELRRGDALAEIEPPQDRAGVARERAAVCSLLARQAPARRDVRLLNAALKLADRFAPRAPRLVGSAAAADWARALSDVESALAELERQCASRC